MGLMHIHGFDAAQAELPLWLPHLPLLRPTALL